MNEWREDGARLVFGLFYYVINKGDLLKETNILYYFQGKEAQNVKKTIIYFIGVFACW